MSSGTILYDRSSAAAHIVISNPAKRNAMSMQMWQGLSAAIRRANDDEQVRVILVTGAGKEAFVSGADITRFSTERADPEAANRYTLAISEAMDRLVMTSKPVIAMIRGYCLGGGMDIAASCDLRYCSENAQFSIPAARIGLGYSIGMVRRLTNVVGYAAAREMLITGKRISARRAYDIGLVHRVITEDSFESSVQEEIALIAQNAPLSVRAAKLGIALLEQGVDATRLAEHDRLVALCNASEDHAEGVRAFLEKRPPCFKGR